MLLISLSQHRMQEGLFIFRSKMRDYILNICFLDTKRSFNFKITQENGKYYTYTTQ